MRKSIVVAALALLAITASALSVASAIAPSEPTALVASESTPTVDVGLTKTVVPAIPNVAALEDAMDAEIAKKKAAGDWCDCSTSEGPFPCDHSSSCRQKSVDGVTYNGLKPGGGE